MDRLSQTLDRDVWELFDVSTNLGSDGLTPFLERVLSRCREWFSASSASIFLRQGSSANFSFAAGEKGLKGVEFDSGHGIAGVAIRTGEAMLVNDPGDHPLLRDHIRRSSKAYSSSMVVPLMVNRGEVVGVLNVARKSGLAEFCQADLDRAQTLARLIALAVANARLFVDVREASAQALALQARLQAVLQSIETAVVVVDHSGTLTNWNRAAADLLGIRSPGKLSRRRSPSSELTQVIRELAAESLGGNRGSARVPGERSWNVTAIPLADGATLTIQETTEHDLAEREMQRLARLAEIGQMTAAIAHEIRNPLTGIRSAAQMIPLAPEQADEFASIIEVEVTKLSDLCTGFLEFSRPLLLKSSPQRLDGVVRGVVARLQSEFDRAGVQLNLEIAPQAPTIHMDASRIEQVLRNLLLNALEASKRGGRVDVRVDGDGFEVRDDGAGIGEEQKARLFTPFFTTKAQGTGLGLSNVRKIIDAHGAKIDVWSKVGQGTRFRVKFRQEAA